MISKLPRERKGGNIWPLLLLTTGYWVMGIQAASPGQRIFSALGGRVSPIYLHNAGIYNLHQFCKAKATVSSSKII